MFCCRLFPRHRLSLSLARSFVGLIVAVYSRSRFFLLLLLLVVVVVSLPVCFLTISTLTALFHSKDKSFVFSHDDYTDGKQQCLLLLIHWQQSLPRNKADVSINLGVIRTADIFTRLSTALGCRRCSHACDGRIDVTYCCLCHCVVERRRRRNKNEIELLSIDMLQITR